MENAIAIPMEDVEKKTFEDQNVDIIICQRLYGEEKAVGIAEYVSGVTQGDIITDDAGDYYIAIEDSINVSKYSKETRELLNGLNDQKMVEYFEANLILKKANRR